MERSESNISYKIYTIATEKPKRTVLIGGKFVAKQKIFVSSVEEKF
jgi:hypothetical protein